MSTVQKGDAFENRVFSVLKELVESEQLAIDKKNYRIFQKKGYYSKTQETDIIFDVSIEVYMPNADEFSYLYLIECNVMVGRHLLGGAKAGVEYIRSTPIIGMAFGGDVSYLTDGGGKAVLITPRLMLSLVKVEIFYGYNFFVRNDLTRWVGHHRFGVSMTLNPRFWRRKKQTYEDYYDTYR